jgi:hypothetical protein
MKPNTSISNSDTIFRLAAWRPFLCRVFLHLPVEVELPFKFPSQRIHLLWRHR